MHAQLVSSTPTLVKVPLLTVSTVVSVNSALERLERFLESSVLLELTTISRLTLKSVKFVLLVSTVSQLLTVLD